MSQSVFLYPGHRYDVMNASRLRYLGAFARSIKGCEASAPIVKDLARRALPYGDDLVRVPITYTPRRSPNGRLFAEYGLQGVDRHVRSFLLPADTVDLDIVRCAPSILLRLAERLNVARHQLTAHLANYESRLDEIGGDKGIMIGIMFGGTAYNKSLKETPSWVGKLQMELACLYDEYKSVEPELHEIAVAKYASSSVKDRDCNIQGTFLAYLYQKYENAYMRAVDTAGQRFGMWSSNSTLMFDGITFQPCPLNTVDTQLLQAYANRETGLELELVVKPLPRPIHVDITRIPRKIVIAEADREAGEILAYLSGGRLVGCNGMVWYCDDNRCWRENTSKATTFLTKLAVDSNMVTVGDKGQEKQYSNFHSHALDAAKTCLTALVQNEDFGRYVIQRDYNKLHFKNGYWEFLPEQDKDTGIHGRFVEGKFERVGFVNYDFPEYNEEHVQFVNEKFVEPAFRNSKQGEKELFFETLARALAGDSDKAFNLVLGFRDSSKSVLFNLLKTAIGQLMAGVDATNLAYTQQQNGDASRDHKYLLSCQYARIVVISETKEGKAGILDGKKIKQIQSPKDGIEVRDLYANQGRPIYPLITPFILCNHLPKTAPADALVDHCKVFSLRNRFVSKQVKAGHALDPTYILADKRVDDWSKELKYGKAFLNIILEYYKPTPPEPLPDMNELVEIDNQDKSEEFVLDLFEITGNPADRVDYKEVQTILATKDINPSSAVRILQKLMDETLRGSGKALIPNVIARPRVNGRQIKMLQGVRKRDHMPSGYYHGGGGTAPMDVDDGYQTATGSYARGVNPSRSGRLV